MIKITIGRDRQCAICFENYSQVSSKHGELVISDDGRIAFTDYSTNGSFVNGQLVHHTSVFVNYGDAIVFPGNAVLDWNVVAELVRHQQSGGYQSAPQQPQQPQQAPQAEPARPQANAMASNSSYSSGETLSFSQTMSEGFSSGLKNSLSMVGAVILWMLTIWVPYINIGTTIAILTLPMLYARKEAFNPAYIFDSSFRRIMGNYLLLTVFRNLIVFVSSIFMVIPSIVMTLTYMLSDFYLVEEGQDPIKAMQSSARATYGSKWTIFGIILVYAICYNLVALIFIGLTVAAAKGGAALAIVVGLISFVAMIAMGSVAFGIVGSIWRQLKAKGNE